MDQVVGGREGEEDARRCRTNIAHPTQSSPDPGLGFQVKPFKLSPKPGSRGTRG